MKHSFCTPVKGRLVHLQETYLRNIEAAQKVGGDHEFVLSNFDSNDGLDEWVEKNLIDYVKAGVVAYYRTTQPYPLWKLTEAFNTTMRKASGHILTNLHADHFLSTKAIEEHRRITIDRGCDLAASPQALTDARIVSPPGCCGLLTIRRLSFLRIGGYDERLNDWGYDDIDLVKRCIKKGYKIQAWTNKYVKAIQHENDLRYRFCQAKNLVENNSCNNALSNEAIENGQLVANAGKDWGAFPMKRVYF